MYTKFTIKGWESISKTLLGYAADMLSGIMNISRIGV